MVDRLVVWMDRTLASSCLEHGEGMAVGSVGFDGQLARILAVQPFRCRWIEEMMGSTTERKGFGEVAECRICQEEGEENEMELPAPAAFAHRKCIQRWCDKKGNIICELCKQAYAPDYSVSPSSPISDYTAIDIERGWGSRIELNNSHFLAIAAAEQQFRGAEYEDFAISNNSGIVCFRTVAFMLMLVLFASHILSIAEESEVFRHTTRSINISVLQLSGFFLPCYAAALSCYIIQSRWRRQRWGAIN
ncbi:unnamed protein product [Spirodela intermedia]|uniref:RING-CH-type domain-containing protein n=1 Tax=Spirodela intermedia TaxID=51605 RepID=A0A7I8IRZ0_SPIIN|nr:unnamed protein product [Spirodela intermedia]CAA6660326.1 unnamed protein product [Spirodela intermedia]